MSARWTLGCRRDRLRRVVAAKPGTLTSGTSPELTFFSILSSPGTLTSGTSLTFPLPGLLRLLPCGARRSR